MISFDTADGLTLEGAWTTPQDPPTGVAVLCHPHPLHQGTMNAPLLRSVAGRLADAGICVLRFNFRGVEGSQGSWGEGEAEIEDVAAAVAHAAREHPTLPLHVAGWSFGAITALQWQARTGSTARYAGIAPPVRLDGTPTLPDPADLAAAPRLFVIGDRDQFGTVDDLTAYAEAVNARIEVIPGSDHFFVFRDMQVGRIVAAFLDD